MEAEVWMPPSSCASAGADPDTAPTPEEWTVRGRVRVQPLREGLRSTHDQRRYEGAEPWLAAGVAAGGAADDACQASFMRPRVSVCVEALMPDGAPCRPAHCVASDECDDAAADAHAASLYAVEKRTRQVQLSEGVCGGQTLRLSFSATAGAAAIDSSFGTNPASSLPASPAVSRGFHLLDRPAGGGVAEGVAPRVLRPFFPPGYQRSTLVHVSVDSFVSSLHGTFGEIDPLWLGLSCYAYDAGGGGGGSGAATLLCEPYYRSYFSNVVRSAAADGTFDSRAEPSSCLLHVPHSVASSPRHKVLLVVKVYRKLTGPSSQRAQVLYDTPVATHEAAGSRRRKKVEEELDGGMWLGRTELGWRVVALPKDDGDAINLTYLYKPVQEKKAAAAAVPGAQDCWFDVPHPSQHLALVTSPACVTPPALCLHIFLRRSGARSLGLVSGGAQSYVQDERLDTFPFTCVMATEQVEADQVRGCAGAGRQCRIAAGSAEVAAVATPCLLRNDGHPVSVPPQTVRGELYVRLNSLALVKNCNLRNPGDLRTLLVEAALRTSDDPALGDDAVVPDAFLDWKGEGGRASRHFCSVSHHARVCSFDEQLVVFPPRQADATAAYHILFSIYHVSFKGKSPSLVPAGYAVLHLSNAAGVLSVPDGEHVLKVLSPSTELYTSIFERKDLGYFAALNRPHEAGPHSSDDPKCQKLFWNAGSCGLSVTTYTNCSATSAGTEAADADTASVARLLSCLDAAAGHDGGEGAALAQAEGLLLADTGGLAPDLLAGALPAVVDRLLQTMRQAGDEGTRARVTALLLAAFGKMGDGAVADDTDAPQPCAPCAEEDGHDVVTCVLGTHPEKDALHGAAAWYCASVFSDEGAGGEPAWSLLLGAAAASGLAGPLAALGGCNDSSPSARHGARARVLKNFFSLVLRSVLLGFHAVGTTAEEAAADTGDHFEAFRAYAAEQGLVEKLRACFVGCAAGLVSGASKEAETEEEEAEEEKGAEDAAGVVTAVGVVFGLFLADLSPLLRVDEVAYILDLQTSTAEEGDEGSAAAAAAAASGRALLDAGAASGFLNRVPRFLPFLPAFAGHTLRLLRVQLAVRAAEAARYRAERGGVDADRRYFRLFLRHRRPVVAAARVVAEVVALARGATSCCGAQREAALQGVLRGGCAGDEVSGVWRWYVEAVAVGEVCIDRSIARHAEQVARMQAYARRGGGGGGDEAALLAATVCAKQAYLAKEEETLAEHHARCRRTLRLLAGLAATAARHAAAPPMPLLLALPSVVDALRTDGCAQRRSAHPLQDLCRLLDGGDVAPWPWACGALAEPRSPHPPGAPVLSFLYLSSAAAADSALAALEREVAPTHGDDGGDGDARRLLCMRVVCGLCDGVADALRTNPLEYPEAVWRAVGRLAAGVREGTLYRRAVGASLAIAGFAGAADEAAAAALAQCSGAQPQQAACVFSAACAGLLAAHAAGRRVGVKASPSEGCAVIVGNGAGEVGPAAAAAAGIEEMASLLAQAPALAAPVPVVRLLLQHGAADVAFGFVRHAVEGCSGHDALTLHTVAALLSLVLVASCEATHPCWGCFRELSDTCEGLCDEALACCPATLRCGLAARFEMSVAEPSLPPTPPLVEVEASAYTAYACEHLLEAAATAESLSATDVVQVALKNLQAALVPHSV